MDVWAAAFGKFKLPVAQLLLTREDIDDRTRFLNVRNTIHAAHEMGAPMTFDPRQPYVMGHEFACEVLELGAGVDSTVLAPGTLVTSMPAMLVATGGSEMFACGTEMLPLASTVPFIVPLSGEKSARAV